jgi:serine phosphatase RsbU (regulator of sigma subunit)
VSAPRQGISISVKLILATSLVVAAAVGLSTWFGKTTIDQLTSTQQKLARDAREASNQRESELVTQAVAQAVAYPLTNNVYPEIGPLLDQALRDDEASTDKEQVKLDPNVERHLQWLVVIDREGQIVAATDGAVKQGIVGKSEAKFTTTERFAKLQKQLSDAGGLKASPDQKGVVHAQLDKPTHQAYGTVIEFGGKPQGELAIGVSTEILEKQLDQAERDAKERADASRNRVLLVSLAILAIGVVLAALQGVQLARPIRALTVGAERIAGGDLASRVPDSRRDELGVLAKTFNLMANEISRLLADQLQKVSLEKEMSLARQVQQAMLPPDTLDQHGYLKVVGYCMPASSCGGDWWMYRKLPNGRMLLVVGDATGHGIHSAMIAATARGAVEALSGIDERLLTPEQVLRAIDSAIKQVGDHNVLMTAFAAVFDSTTGILHYANAGQNFPYIIKLAETRVLAEASIIAASGNPLGDRNIAVEIRRGSLQLRPGDLFVCFTDGVVERANRAGKLFGDRRLRGALTGHPLPDGAALVQLRNSIVAALDRYAEGALAEDDITLVLCQFDPPASRPLAAGRGAA